MRHLLCLAAVALAQPLAAQAPAVPAQPPLSAEQSALGRRLAESGDLSAILNTAGGQEIAQMAANTPGLSDAERAQLRRIGAEVLATDRGRILGALGDAYARHFTMAQLRAVLAFLESPDGRAYVGALPQILPQMIAEMQNVDLGRDVRAAFCREAHKLCEDRAAPAGQ